jgi:SNW domain-containing protein 1
VCTASCNLLYQALSYPTERDEVSEFQALRKFRYKLVFYRNYAEPYLFNLSAKLLSTFLRPIIVVNEMQQADSSSRGAFEGRLMLGTSDLRRPVRSTYAVLKRNFELDLHHLRLSYICTTSNPPTMTSVAAGLFKSLPKPKYTGEDEELPAHAQPRGPRIVGPAAILENQIAVRVSLAPASTRSSSETLLQVLQRSGPPPYGQRTGWRPRAQEDYGDGGAFPEIPVAQYPLDMGRKSTSRSNALAVQVDAEGKVKYDAIARQGHSDKRIVHTSFKDLIPLRQRADMGEISLEKPSAEEIAEQTEKTKQALAVLVSGAVAAQKPKNVKGGKRNDPTYVRYTPANQMGDTSKKNDRIMKIVERQQDPMEPPKFKHKKIPRGPPSPPPPVMHSPPRKLTAEDQEAWKIPPPISNWKNPKGYTVPLDKRLAADGRGLQDVTINDKFAQFAEALFTADRHAREEVKQRAFMQQKLAEKEKAQKEEHLRQLAQKAREERQSQSAAPSSLRRARSRSNSTSSSYSTRSRTRSHSRSDSADSAARARIKARRERRQDNERQLRQSRMGTERRIQMMAREQNRDISEKVALGLAKPTQSSEGMWDSRLFNQTSGFDTGFNEDQPYDKPLFAAQDAISSIYRPKASGDDEGDGEEEMGRIERAGRFEVLGRAKEGFKGASDAEVCLSLSLANRDGKLIGVERQARDGPVQFEKDTDDPFGIDSMIKEVTGGQGGSGGTAGRKRYGLEGREEREAEERQSKRARVEDDD